MKKSILLTGAMMLMLSSCSNEEVLPNEEVKNQTEPTLTIIATQGEDADSRLAFVDEKNLAWTSGDQILVTEAGVPETCVLLTLQETEQTKTGTFSTTDKTTDKELEYIQQWKSANTPLVAYYKNEATLIVEDGELMIPQVYDMPEEGIVQIQTANNSNAHLTGFNHMVSNESFTLSDETTEVNLKFSQQGAIMKFVLSGMGGETVKSLKLECGGETPFFAMFYQIGTDIDDESLYYMCTPFTTLYLGENGEGIMLGTDETLTAYLMLPTTEWLENMLGEEYEEEDVEERFATLSFKLTAMTENAPYTASVNGGKLGAGKFYTIQKDMTKLSHGLNGEGTSESPYQLGSKADLEALATFVANGGGTAGKYFRLQNDIDLENTCPVISTFEGIFDGNEKTIRNYKDSYGECLFHTVEESGIVKNLTITGGFSSASAGIVCYNYGTISGCVNEINITYHGGGIVNQNHGLIEGCVNKGNIGSASTNYYSGGICNCNYGGIIKACYNLGNVTLKEETVYSAGGISGYFNSDESSIIGCYNMGEISGAGNQGGICGDARNYTSTILNCYWGNSSISAIGMGNTEISACAKVTGEGENTWEAAMEAMNTALADSGWQYELNTDAATRDKEPLVLKKTN